jgi:hypothetical protein
LDWPASASSTSPQQNGNHKPGDNNEDERPKGLGQYGIILYHDDENLAANAGGVMRIFIFKSEAKSDLGAFGGDLAGLQLPSQFKPWRAVGAVAPDNDPPYKLSREVIEASIKERGFQLFRLSKKD